MTAQQAPTAPITARDKLQGQVDAAGRTRIFPHDFDRHSALEDVSLERSPECMSLD